MSEMYDEDQPWHLTQEPEGQPCNLEDDFEVYDLLIKAGVAPEQARMILPQSTLTEWYWSGSLDAFADMCRLRCKEDTQYESRVVANQISTIMEGLYPVSWKALMQQEGIE